jgi:hypothetical protein
MNAREQQKEFLEKHLRIRRFMNRWVSTPCLIVSIVMLFSFPEMALFWLLMTVLNGFAVLTNWAVGNAIERNLSSLDMISEVDRQRKIDELYGRNSE